MAAGPAIGRAVVKSAARGELTPRSPRRHRKAAARRSFSPLHRSAIAVEHSVDSAISLAKRSDSLGRATIFFFATAPCGYSRKFCKITRRKRMIHSGRTRLEVSQRELRRRARARRNAAAETRVGVPHVQGGVVRVQCCHCRGEQLIRFSWSPRSATATKGILVAAIVVLLLLSRPRRTTTTITTTTTMTTTIYDKDDGVEGVMRQGILSVIVTSYKLVG